MRRFLILTMVLGVATITRADQQLIVHEWGTFTSLQDESGRTIGGINVDDEPLPKFVHKLDPMLLINANSMPPVYYQGAPAAHPGVTMRLETPVVYFHQEQAAPPLTVDVHVQFEGGWLTQFYPNADSRVDGKVVDSLDTRPLTQSSLGTLAWNKVQLGAGQTGPQTDDHVWTAPRAVAAADVTTDIGESERFLFYRGVGHLDAPVLVLRNAAGARLTIHNRKAAIPGPFWLVDIRSDGNSAYRSVDSEVKHLGDFQAETSATFADNEYSRDNIAKLRKEMRAALVHAGLFADEAEALLSTWELSYFKSVGQRVFFLVPRQWTDEVLPLSISVPCQIERVMVGRIELVGPRERNLLKKIAQSPASNPVWGRPRQVDGKIVESTEPPPADYKAYRELGRFRDALLLDEQRRRPTTGLDQFIANYGLQPARIQPAAATRPAAALFP